MAKRYTRKALKKPDEFVSFWQRTYDAALPYGRAIGYSLLGAVAVLAAVWSIQYFSDGKRQQATEQFAQATRIAEGDLITDENPAKTEDKLPRFKTEKDRGEAAVAELDKLDKEHGSSDVAKRALLFKAGLLYDLARFPEAEGAYRKFLERAGDDDPTRPLAKEGIGLCQEAGGKLDDALATYKELEPKAGDFYRDRALYDQARVMTKKGDKKGAEQLYRDILAKTPTTPLKEDVEARLGLLGAAVPPSMPPLPLGGG